MSLCMPAHAGVTLGGERQHCPGVRERLARSSPNPPFKNIQWSPLSYFPAKLGCLSPVIAFVSPVHPYALHAPFDALYAYPSLAVPSSLVVRLLFRFPHSRRTSCRVTSSRDCGPARDRCMYQPRTVLSQFGKPLCTQSRLAYIFSGIMVVLSFWTML